LGLILRSGSSPCRIIGFDFWLAFGPFRIIGFDFWLAFGPFRIIGFDFWLAFGPCRPHWVQFLHLKQNLDLDLIGNPKLAKTRIDLKRGLIISSKLNPNPKENTQNIPKLSTNHKDFH